MSILSENIRKYREFRNMKQLELADKLGKSRNVISNWERGENSPDPDTIELICQILKITPNQMFGWEPCPEYEEFIRAKQRAEETLSMLEEKKRQIEVQIRAQQEQILNMFPPKEEE